MPWRMDGRWDRDLDTPVTADVTVDRVKDKSK
jgi:hypothetical protein